MMEESVMRVVNEICDDAEASENAASYCTTPDCRMDTACYVLNRIPQRYVSSARGHAYAEIELDDDRQLFVDIMTLAHEGLRRVSSVRRSFYETGSESAPPLAGPHFYLPTVKGRLLHGTSFALVSGVRVKLLMDDRPVTMLDARWQNPYEVVEHTPGTYLFWPAPVAAQAAGDRRSFEFEVCVDDERFEPLHHFFTLERTSTGQPPDALGYSGAHRLPDLYLLPAS